MTHNYRTRDQEWPISVAACSDKAVEIAGLFTPPSSELLSVSVIVPVFNSHETVSWTLIGLAKQDYPAAFMEVVIADDGSQTDYQGIIERTWPWPVKFVRQADEGFRLASVRNLGAQAAAGDVLVFIDSDVVPRPSFVSSHLRWYSKLRQIAVFGPRRFVDLPREPCPDSPDDVLATLERQPRILCDSNFGLRYDRRGPEIGRFAGHPFAFHLFHGCNASVRRSEWAHAGGFDSEFDGNWGYEDTEFAFRLHKIGVRFIADPEALGFHLDTPGSSAIQRRTQELANFTLACSKIPGFAAFKAKLKQENRKPWW